jgi:hypothetical protein
MTPQEHFQTYGALYARGAISKELAQFCTHALMVKNAIAPTGGDKQVPNSTSVMHGELIFDTLLERVWPLIEVAVGEELFPTYSYVRLYGNGDTLEKHKDRPSCEISATLQLGRSHHYSWPIYMGSYRYDMAEGDAVIYKGCDVEHWRDRCDGPDGYYSGQAFLHFVRVNGQHKEWAGDKRWKDLPFSKFRTLLMENK